MLDNLLDNFRGVMSSLLEDMSGTLQTQIGAIAHNISKSGEFSYVSIIYYTSEFTLIYYKALSIVCIILYVYAWPPLTQ